jgi:transposase
MVTAVKNKIRRLATNYNADRKDLFTAEGWASLAAVNLSAADRFVLGQLEEHWRHLEKQLRGADQALKAFARKAPAKEAEARAVLRTIPAAGPLTVEVVLSALGDVQRFRSAKQVVAYAGLAPGRRESAGKSKELSITKEGSGLLRWILVQAAWRLRRRSQRWQRVFEQLRQRRGSKKAIVAVARRLLGVMVALLRTGQSYRLAM